MSTDTRDGLSVQPATAANAEKSEYWLNDFMDDLFEEVCRKAGINDGCFVPLTTDEESSSLKAREIIVLFEEYAITILALYGIGRRFSFRRYDRESFAGEVARNILNLSVIIDSRTSPFVPHGGTFVRSRISWRIYGRDEHRGVHRRKLHALLGGFQVQLYGKDDIKEAVSCYQSYVIEEIMEELSLGKIGSEWGADLRRMIRVGYEEMAWETDVFLQELIRHPRVYRVLGMIIEKYPGMDPADIYPLRDHLLKWDEEIIDGEDRMTGGAAENHLLQRALEWLDETSYDTRCLNAEN